MSGITLTNGTSNSGQDYGVLPRLGRDEDKTLPAMSLDSAAGPRNMGVKPECGLDDHELEPFACYFRLMAASSDNGDHFATEDT
jgi:hypothetical protein